MIEARKSAGMTQEALSKRLGRPQSFVSKYERGERRLEVVEFLWITEVLGIDAADLVRKIGHMKQRNRL